MVEKFWFEKAREFLEIAEGMIREGRYWMACFSSQQAADFLLKGLQLKYTATHLFTHDLSTLLNEVAKILNLNPPPEIYLACDYLTPHYTLARYSQISTYDKRKAEECVRQARKIFQWISEATQ